MKSKRRQKHWRKWRVFKDVTLSKIPNSETPQYYWANICHRAEWIQSENIWCCQNGLNCALSLNVAPQKRLVVSGTLAQLTFWGFWKDSESDPFWKPTMVRRCSIPFNAIPVQVLTKYPILERCCILMTPAPLRVWKSHLPQLDFRLCCFCCLDFYCDSLLGCLVSWSLSSCLRSLGFDEVSEQGYISLPHHCQNFDGLQDKYLFCNYFYHTEIHAPFTFPIQFDHFHFQLWQRNVSLIWDSVIFGHCHAHLSAWSLLLQP